MVKRCISEVLSLSYVRPYVKSIKDQMFKVAIRSNGVYDTFDFQEYPAPQDNVELQLCYMQVSDDEIANISEYHYKVMYFTDADCFGDAKYIGEQYYDATVNKIKEDLVKDKNAIWSTISINEVGPDDKRRFEIRYKQVVNTDDAKKSSETDKMLTESDNSKKHTKSEIYDISSVSMRDGTTHKISDLVTYDKEYLYFPIEFGPVHSSSIIRLKIPLKTLKEALDQVE